MSLDDQQISNKMMQAPPDKKGFHFASDGIHKAAYILAETIEEATELYHKTKKLLDAPAGVATTTPVTTPADAPDVSTPAEPKEQSGSDVQ